MPEKIGSGGKRLWRGRGEGGRGGEYEGIGYSRRGKDREGEKKRDVLIEGDIEGLVRNMAQGKFPGIHKDYSN